MKKTLMILIASATLTAAIGLPAWSAMRTPGGESPRPFAAILEGAALVLPLVLASDDDGDEDRGDHATSRRGHDDGDDEDDDGCDDDACSGVARNPAPAGTVAPPKNGLFGNGALPKVKVK